VFKELKISFSSVTFLPIYFWSISLKELTVIFLSNSLVDNSAEKNPFKKTNVYAFSTILNFSIEFKVELLISNSFLEIFPKRVYFHASVLVVGNLIVSKTSDALSFKELFRTPSIPFAFINFISVEFNSSLIIFCLKVFKSLIHRF